MLHSVLTDGIFETGAYGVPSKSQNLTILRQGGPSRIKSIIDLIQLDDRATI